MNKEVSDNEKFRKRENKIENILFYQGFNDQKQPKPVKPKTSEYKFIVDWQLNG